MKKIFKLGICTLLILLQLTGCGKQELNIGSLNDPLEEIVSNVYTGISKDEMPKLGNIEINEENMAYYLGIDDLKIEEGLASEPMMSSIAWSVVVIRVSDEEDINDAKTRIKDNVDPAKWLCVDAEEVIVESNKNTIILIMMDESNTEYASIIQKNFQNLK